MGQGQTQSISAGALFGRGGSYTLATMVSMASGLVVLPFLTRALSSAEFGTLALALALQQLVAAAVSLGLPAAVSRFYFDEGGPEASEQLVHATFVTAALGTGMVLTTVTLWSPVFTPSVPIAALAAGLASAFPLAGLGAVTARLRTEGRAAAFVALSTTSAVFPAATGLVAVYVWESTALAFLVGAVVVRIAVLLAAWLATVPGYALPPRQVLTAALRLGFPTLPHLTAMYVLSVGDRFVIDHAIGPEAVARYQVAYQIGNLGIVAVAALNGAWSPLVFAIEDDAHRNAELARSSRMVLRTGALIVISLSLVAPWALAVAAPGEYDPIELLPVTVVVALATLPYIFYLSSVHVLFQAKSTVGLAIASSFSAVLNVVLNVVAVPRYGLMAAAWATVVAYCIQAAVVHVAASKLATITWDARERSIVVLVSSACVLGTLGLPSAGPGGAARIVLAAGLAVLGLMQTRRWALRDLTEKM